MQMRANAKCKVHCLNWQSWQTKEANIVLKQQNRRTNLTRPQAGHLVAMVPAVGDAAKLCPCFVTEGSYSSGALTTSKGGSALHRRGALS